MRKRDQFLAAFLFPVTVVIFAIGPAWADGPNTLNDGNTENRVVPGPPIFVGGPRGGGGGASRGAAGQQQQGQQQQQQQAQAAQAAGGGGGGGAQIPKDPNREKADLTQKYGKEARDAINKGLDKFTEGVKALNDGFKESLAAVSKLPEDNMEIMKDLRKNIENITAESAKPIGAEQVAQITAAIDRNGQTQIDMVTKAAQAFVAGRSNAAEVPGGINNGGAPLASALNSRGGGVGGGGGLSSAANASAPNANSIPSFGRGPGPFGGGNGFMSFGSSPRNSIDFNLREREGQGAYNPPELPTHSSQ